MTRAALISLVPLAACAAEPGRPLEFAYLSAETSLLDENLVQVRARMTGLQDGGELDAYSRCAVARFALENGFGFARHLRTNVTEEGGVWSADAVYTISPSLPRGLATIDAETELAACEENAIPTV